MRLYIRTSLDTKCEPGAGGVCTWDTKCGPEAGDGCAWQVVQTHCMRLSYCMRLSH